VLLFGYGLDTKLEEFRTGSQSLPKVGIISQARMTSTRLPGKVLKTIQGKSLLQYHIDRLRWSKLPIVIATTVNQSDQPIVDFAGAQNLPVYRGSEHDVLSRFHGAVAEHGFDIVVRVTSDCPLLDGFEVAKAVDVYLGLNKPWVYLTNCIERTYPRGFDYEIFSAEMLNEAFAKATTTPEREHVNPYMTQNKHGKTHFHSITHSPNTSGYRLTVDEVDDFRLMEKLIADYGCAGKTASEIEQVLLTHPELQKINSHIEQKKV
jgi:spore coat polysaccharide biosynthesis protein SpsF